VATEHGRVLTDEEKREWLTSRGAIRRGPHSYTRKIRHWPFCSRCGLILLRNDATERAARRQCEWEE
jgi:hypothetical protein